jgi:hypothetical protein
MTKAERESVRRDDPVLNAAIERLARQEEAIAILRTRKDS